VVGLAALVGAITWAPSRTIAPATAAPAPLPPVTAASTTTTTLAATTTTTTAPAAPATAAPAVSNQAVVCTQPAPPTDLTPAGLATPNVAGLTYAASPGGPAVGQVASRWGGPSTRPIVGQQNGWLQIRISSRPNGSTGWVPAAAVTISTTDLRVVISTCLRSLTVFQGATPVYSAPVGVGRPQWPTPLGPAFVDAVLTTPRREVSVYGPTIFVLGVHSNVFTDFGGGDGTVAVHGYPSDPASTRGVASSHGCVRAGPATINFLTNVPVGTPVDIIA
jgi:hypothetical protein